MNGVWIPEEEGRTKASFLSSKSVDCSVPRLSNMAVDTMDFTASEQPYARWEIKVPVHQSQGQVSVRGFMWLIFHCRFLRWLNESKCHRSDKSRPSFSKLSIVIERWSGHWIENVGKMQLCRKSPSQLWVLTFKISLNLCRPHALFEAKLNDAYRAL